MHKMIEILKQNLGEEIDKAKGGLTPSRLDALYKLTSTIKNMECMEKEEWEPASKMAEVAESVMKKYSNGRYDHNIDALYDAYIEAKKKYKEVGDQGHRDKLMECVGRLMVEVYDMLSSIAIDADFKDEKDEVMRHIRRLADM